MFSEKEINFEIKLLNGDDLIPEIQHLGWARRTSASQSLGEHAHSGYEICCIVSGSVDWWAPEGVYEVSPGDIFLTRPGEPHGGLDAMMHPCELYWMIFQIPRRSLLPGLNQQQTRELQTAFSAMTLRHFPGPAELPGRFQRLIEEHRTLNSLSTLAARALFHEILIDVLRAHASATGKHQRNADDSTDPIGRAAARIDANPAADWRVEELASTVGLSVSHFHEQFSRRIGFAPAEYRTRRRIRAAKQLLRDTSTPVTEMAQSLGFSTSQYFATVFKNLTGFTPGAYRSRSRGLASAAPPPKNPAP